MSLSNKTSAGNVYLGWCICTMFFFFQYMLRAFPNIMSQEIFNTYKISAEEFGTLGSIYSLTYGVMQIPMGFLIDRMNLRHLSLIAIFLCICGGLMFGMAQDFYILQIARFILGIGSSAALGITLKIISLNFDGISRSVLSGLTLTIGVLGPILGGYIIKSILVTHDWRLAVIMISMSGSVLFLLSFLGMKVTNLNTLRGIAGAFAHIKAVFDLRILMYAIIAGGIYTPVCVFADLWGARFLHIKFGIPEVEAVNISLSLYFGLAIGSIVLPYLSEKLKQLNLVIIITLLCNALLFCIMIFADNLELKVLYILITAIGFCCGAEMICFNAAWRLVPRSSAALTVGVINAFSIIFTGIFQQAVGVLMDNLWDGKLNDIGMRIYSSDNFVVAISTIPIVLIVCVMMSLVTLRRLQIVNN